MKERTNPLRFRDAFEEQSSYRSFFLSLLIMGLAYGLYKGMLDNFLAEVVGMSEMGRGVTEFFRELPGVLSAESLYKMGAVVALVGMGMHAVLPPTQVLTTLAICMYSLGEHIQIGMKSTLALSYAKPGRGGEALGAQNALNQIGTLAGYIVLVVVFALFPEKSAALYTPFFWLSTGLTAIAMVISFAIRGKSKTDDHRRRFYFHKKYYKFYMLEMFYGARKQVFFTFGPYVLILQYGANAAVISLLFAVSAIVCFFAAPVVGRIIDKLGYKVVMVSDTLILVIVCFFYGFAHRLFPQNVAFLICCINYVLDSVISLAAMASNVYVQDLADNAEEVKATITTGVSINHLITIFIALCGGWIWKTLGIELLFIVSAVLGLCNSAYAATIKTKKSLRV